MMVLDTSLRIQNSPLYMFLPMQLSRLNDCRDPLNDGTVWAFPTYSMIVGTLLRRRKGLFLLMYHSLLTLFFSMIE